MINRRYPLDRWSPVSQLFLLAAISLISTVLFLSVTRFLVQALFDANNMQQVMQSLINDPDNLAINDNQLTGLKFFQMMFSVGAFLVPALVFARLKFPEGDYLKMHVHTPWFLIVVGIITFTLIFPFVSFAYEINEQIHLPSFMSSLEDYMRSSESADDKLTNLFLKSPSVRDLLLNILVLGIIPAICEEFLFRGCIQQLFREWLKNPHVAIWITAALFSFFHFEFSGFFPRMILGAMLGYLFYWSGSIWISVFAHAFNNGIQVLLSYLFEHHIISFDINSDNPLPNLLVILASIASIACIYYFKKMADRHRFIY